MASDLKVSNIAVKAARLSLGMSQREFALRLGVSPAAISGWEVGHYEPNARNLHKIAALSEQPVSALLVEVERERWA